MQPGQYQPVTVSRDKKVWQMTDLKVVSSSQSYWKMLRHSIVSKIKIHSGGSGGRGGCGGAWGGWMRL